MNGILVVEDHNPTLGVTLRMLKLCGLPDNCGAGSIAEALTKLNKDTKWLVLVLHAKPEACYSTTPIRSGSQCRRPNVVVQPFR